MNIETACQNPHRIDKPVGGYCRIPLAWLYGVWWCYRQGSLEFQDVRVYFALHEMVARRCRMSAGRLPRYTAVELQKLTGLKSSRSCRESLRRLEKLGWIAWSPSEIRFLDATGQWDADDQETWAADLGRIANRLRRVPVARLTLQLLCRASQPVLAATVLGHLFRCVYQRGQVITAEGSVAASWIAEVLGVDIRNVKRARMKLRSMGWLFVLPCDHWHRQRYGERIAVNLAWDPRMTHVVSAQTPPPHQPRCTELPPPESNKKLPKGIKNQKPATPGRPGVQMTNPQTPTLRNIQPEALRNADRLLVLFQQAQERRLVGKSEHERLVFAGAAVHATAKATRNPGGFFWSLVRDRLWHHVSATDETQAQSMLKRHLFGSPQRQSSSALVPRRDPQILADVHFVSHVVKSLEAHGYGGNPYEAVTQKAPEWTRERWNAAMRRWLTP